MLIRLTNTASRLGDLDVREATTKLPAGGETGTASIWIDRGDAAFSTDYLAESGGSLVEIPDFPGGPPWVGVTRRPRPEAAGVLVTADEALATASAQQVSLARTVYALNPGTILRMAALDTLGGDADTLLRAGTFHEGSVLVDEYAFGGQSLAAVINDLHKGGGGEARVTAGVLSWLPQSGTVHAPMLDGGHVWGVTLPDDARERVGEVIVLGETSDSYRIRAPETAGANFWRSRSVVTMNTRSNEAMARVAKATLLAGMQPSGRITCFLDPSKWAAVLDGDYLPLIVPSAGLAGRTLVGRVIGRTYRPAAGTMELSLQEIPPFTAALAASVAGDRPASPAPLPGPASFAGAIRDLRRTTA